MATNEESAIKLENAKATHPQLEYEARVYRLLAGGIGIPSIRWFGKEITYNVLVMDLLGPSLEDLFNYCKRRFTLKTVLLLAEQLVSLSRWTDTNNALDSSLPFVTACSSGIRTHQRLHSSRYQARQLFDGDGTTRESSIHYWFWPCEALPWSENHGSYTLSWTKESNRHATICKHQYSPWHWYVSLVTKCVCADGSSLCFARTIEERWFGIFGLHPYIL